MRGMLAGGGVVIVSMLHVGGGRFLDPPRVEIMFEGIDPCMAYMIGKMGEGDGGVGTMNMGAILPMMLAWRIRIVPVFVGSRRWAETTADGARVFFV